MAAATPARADSPACGTELLTDLVLDHDLHCGGDGLQIGADHLVIDLGGHELSGTGTGTGITTNLRTGPFQDVTIRNGTVRNFDTGIYPSLWHGTGVHVSDLTVRNVRVGIDGYGSYGGIEIENSEFRNNSSSAVLGAGNPVRVRNSAFQQNGIALSASWGGGLRVTTSRFNRNDVALSASQNGIDLTDSTFHDNGTAVAAFLSGVGAHGNRFAGGGIAIDVSDDFFGMQVTGNTISGAALGMRIRGPLSDTATNTVAGNRFDGNGAAGLWAATTGTTVPLTVTGNNFRRNGFDPGAYLDANGAALTSGLWISGGTVSGNLAVGNAGYGIEAYGAIDGGGNRARRNGATPQCLGVACTS